MSSETLKNNIGTSRIDFVKKNTREDEINKIDEIMHEISSAKRDMSIARQNFECVCGRNDVDIYIYKLKDAQSRYVKLLAELKTLM